MVRKYKLKKTPVDRQILKIAVQAVKKYSLPLKTAAKQFQVSRTTLRRWLGVNADVENTLDNMVTLHPGAKNIFSDDAEKTLADYLLRCNDMYFGLSTKQTRKLAYEFAQKLELKIPPSWKKNGMAGEDWLAYFLKRHVNLSLRKPEATSLARVTSFNKLNVERFFAMLKDTLDEFSFPAHSIWNMDETGITTVQNPEKVISRRGSKQVGRVVSAERGNLVTLATAISATGCFLPPFFIFPRKNFKQHFLNGGPLGCDGAANTSGWMNGDIFFKFLQFFQAHVRASKENPVLLILDNHESHLSINGLEFCKLNGITVISLPPHCSHKLQPLDRTVFGPFKRAVNSQCDFWMTAHPGRSMTIYDIPGITKNALQASFTYQNIVSGFRCTGIFPFNRCIFQDSEFAPSLVMDREDPDIVLKNENSNNLLIQSSSGASSQNLSSASAASNDVADVKLNDDDEKYAFNSTYHTDQDLSSVLESISPYPKAGPRKQSRRGRKRRNAAVLTSSPIMEKLAKDQAAVTKKKKLKISRNNFSLVETKKRGRPKESQGDAITSNKKIGRPPKQLKKEKDTSSDSDFDFEY